MRDLLEEAVTKGYSGCETCEELQAAILEAEKCAEAALQTALGRRRGSGSSVGGRGGASLSGEMRPMDVEELVKFMEQVESLPCKIPEANILQV